MTRPNYSLGAELFGLLFTGIVIIVLVPMIGAWWTLLVGAVLVTGLTGGSLYLYANEKILLDFSYTAVATFLIYTLLNFLSYARGSRTAANQEYLLALYVARNCRPARRRPAPAGARR